MAHVSSVRRIIGSNEIIRLLALVMMKWNGLECTSTCLRRRRSSATDWWWTEQENNATPNASSMLHPSMCPSSDRCRNKWRFHMASCTANCHGRAVEVKNDVHTLSTAYHTSIRTQKVEFTPSQNGTVSICFKSDGHKSVAEHKGPDVFFFFLLLCVDAYAWYLNGTLTTRPCIMVQR